MVTFICLFVDNDAKCRGYSNCVVNLCAKRKMANSEKCARKVAEGILS